MEIDNATRNQIITAYDVLEMTPDMIVEQLDIDPDIVEYVLMQHRNPKPAEGQTATGNSDLSLEALMHEYRLVSKFSKNENVRATALWNLINELKGRNDLEKEHLELARKKVIKNDSQDERIKRFSNLIVNMTVVQPTPDPNPKLIQSNDYSKLNPHDDKDITI